MIIEDLDYYKTSANYTSKLSGIDNPRDFYIDQNGGMVTPYKILITSLTVGDLEVQNIRSI